MPGDKNFKPLAGNTYVILFKYDKPRENDGANGPFDSWGVVVWESYSSYKAKDEGAELYWAASGGIGTLLREAVKSRDTYLKVKVGQEINEKSGKKFNTFEVTDSKGNVYKSQDYKSAPATKNKPSFGEDDDSTDLPPAAGSQTGHQKRSQPKEGRGALHLAADAGDLFDYCLARAWGTIKSSDIPKEFPASFEDIRTIATTLFIAVTNDRSIIPAFSKGERVPPPSDDDGPNGSKATGEEEDVPF